MYCSYFILMKLKNFNLIIQFYQFYFERMLLICLGLFTKFVNTLIPRLNNFESEIKLGNNRILLHILLFEINLMIPRYRNYLQKTCLSKRASIISNFDSDYALSDFFTSNFKKFVLLRSYFLICNHGVGLWPDLNLSQLLTNI